MPVRRNSGFNRDDWEAGRSFPISTAARLLGLKLRGHSTLCPIHADSDPSLYIYDRTNSWYCFGCNRGGHAIELVSAVLGLSSRDALAWLLGRSVNGGGADRSAPKSATRTVEEPGNVPNSALLLALMQSNSLKPGGFDYLKSRGYTSTTVDQFRVGQLGHAPEIHKRLANEFGADALRRSGLLTSGGTGLTF